MKTSVFTLMLNDRPLEQVIPLVGKMGYRGIELMGREPHLPPGTPAKRARELKGLIDAAGLRTSCLATYTGGYAGIADEKCREQLDDLRRFLDLARVFECPVVRHGAGGPSSKEAAPERWERAAGWLQGAADLAAEAGVKLAMELHFGGLTESAEDGVRLCEMVNRPSLGIILDPGNMFIAGVDFGEAAVRAAGDRIFHVHVKDEARTDDPSDPAHFDVEGKLFAHRLLGAGEVDHGPAFAALARMGYEGYLSAECHGAQGDPEQVARHELSALTRLIAWAREAARAS